MNVPEYDLNDLQTTLRDGTVSYWEDDMLALMLIDGVCWTRDAQCTVNQGTAYADTYSGTSVLVGCNDVFAWGCADCEPLPHDKIPELFALWHADHEWGAAKWCCLVRGEKPQAPVVEMMKKSGSWCERMDALSPNRYDAHLASKAQ